MGNGSSSTSSVHQGDVLYTHRMTLLLCGLYYDGKDRMMKKKKVSDGASFDGPNSPNDILLLTTKRSLSCNTRPMIMIYEYLKPAVDIRVMKEIMALREPRCLFFSGIKGNVVIRNLLNKQKNTHPLIHTYIQDMRDKLCLMYVCSLFLFFFFSQTTRARTHAQLNRELGSEIQ
jgi:hypothetical protein